MSIIYNSAVTGVNTPVAITGVIADRPAATNVSEGTVYISTDTQEIFSAQAGSWINVSSGGGGSQDLDQVLAVGNTANNKGMILNGINNSTNQILLSGQYFQSVLTNEEFRLVYFPTAPFDKSLRMQANGISTIFYVRNQTGSAGSYKMIFQYENDDNGKNLFFVRTLGIFTGEERRFEVNASYTGGNSTKLSEDLGGDIAEVEQVADAATTNIYIKIRSYKALLNRYAQITQNRIYFLDENKSTGQTELIPEYDPNNVGFTIFFPEWNGRIANVNERIVDTAVDLSTGNYVCSIYGVYVVLVGSSTNTFDLATFVSNGVNGQFVTICAQNTQVICTNTAGNFYGTATINSNGLYKLMKVGNDIYSSHI